MIGIRGHRAGGSILDFGKISTPPGPPPFLIKLLSIRAIKDRPSFNF